MCIPTPLQRQSGWRTACPCRCSGINVPSDMPRAAAAALRFTGGRVRAAAAAFRFAGGPGFAAAAALLFARGRVRAAAAAVCFAGVHVHAVAKAVRFALKFFAPPLRECAADAAAVHFVGGCMRATAAAVRCDGGVRPRRRSGRALRWRVCSRRCRGTTFCWGVQARRCSGSYFSKGRVRAVAAAVCFIWRVSTPLQRQHASHRNNILVYNRK